MTADRSPDELPVLSLGDGPSTAPVIVPGLGATAVLDPSGDLTLDWESRGAQMEWGGVYAQEVRLTGAWRIRIVLEGVETTLASCRTGFVAHRWAVESRHSASAFSVAQTIVAVDDPPGVLRAITLTSRLPRPATFRVESEFVPYLAPVLIEGVKPYEYRTQTRESSLLVDSGAYRLVLDSEPLPSHLYRNRGSYIGIPAEGETTSVGTDHDVVVPPGGSTSIRWLLWGGVAHELPTRRDPGGAVVRGSSDPVGRAKDAYASWVAGTPELDFPDAPDLTQGYRLARGALRSLYRRSTASMTGLVAGLPWYAAYWCRDIAWMLPAAIWLGDFDWAEATIETVFRYQAPAPIPILGGSRGELPMQVAPGPIFLYGTSDTTLYYPGLACRLKSHSGRATPEPWHARFEAIEGWADEKVEPATGWLRNGGEIQRLTRAADSIGKVHYGSEAVDTTIWDSTDRRDHAVDIQVLWREALVALGELAADGPDAGRAENLRMRADALSARFAAAYEWGPEEYLYDSLGRDGRPVGRVRPNALRAVSAGLLAPETARRVVERAARPDLFSEWGVRTLSSADPGYDPLAYHDGQVWTIATTWLADAAFASGMRELGVKALQTIAARYSEENGLANECYRGDQATPFNSCFLLGFSVAPFLSVLFERLWGISPALSQRRIRVAPGFPSSIPTASLRHLSLAEGHLDLEWRHGQLEARWTGRFSLTLETPRATVELPPDGSPRTAAVA